MPTRDGRAYDCLTDRESFVSTNDAMVKEQQTERLGLRVTKSEARMLEELSEVTGLSMSDVVRMAIRREHAERIGEAAPKPATKKKR